MIGSLAWSAWAEIDVIVRAPGQVIASSHNQVIQSADGGTIKDIFVKEGDHVKTGQTLIIFEQVKPEASYLVSMAKAAALKAAIARLRAEILGGEPKFPDELMQYPEIIANHRSLFSKRQHAIKSDIASLRESRSLAQNELDMKLPLLKSGDVSKADILRLQRQVVDIDSKITTIRNKYFQDCQTELAKNQEDLETNKQVLAQRKEQFVNTVIKAPMDGVVRNVRITTRGGVAKQGEEIMQIVPADDDLIIEAKVQTSDIAFIRPGLPACVKMDAYDYSIYGSLSGVVTYISSDTLNKEEEVRNVNEKPYFKVQVKVIGKNYVGNAAEKIKIQPGMTANVEIRTASHTVWNYLTKPITKTISESMGER